MNTFNEYRVNIKETHNRTVTISAKSWQDAIKIVETKIENGEIVLDDEDYFGRDITIVDNAAPMSDNDCPYCQNKIDMHEAPCETINNKGDDFCIIIHNDEKTATLTTGRREFRILDIAFCPICGKKLFNT